MATSAQLATPPATARSRFGCAYDVAPLGLPGTHERGDNCAIGSPPSPSPQGAARSRLGVRKTSLRWTSQEPTKVATVAQIGAPLPRDGEL